MKDQPLPLNSALDLWPWVHFSLGFLPSDVFLTFDVFVNRHLILHSRLELLKHNEFHVNDLYKASWVFLAY